MLLRLRRRLTLDWGRVCSAGMVCLAFAPGAAFSQDAPALDPALFERLDVNKDGVVTQDEVSDDARTVFKRLLRTADANDDGKLTKQEFKAGLEAKGPTSEAPAYPGSRPGQFLGMLGTNPEQLLKRLDKNGDGKISADEVPAEVAPLIKRALGAVDDGDGALSLDEIKRFMAAMQTGDRPRGLPGGESRGPAPLFAALDLNGDGELTSDEIARASETLKKLDKNGDGKLSPSEVGPPAAEMAEGMEGRRPGSGLPIAPEAARGALASMFTQADKNRDGKLSEDELPPRLRERFSKIDEDGDGFVDKAELTAALARLGGMGKDLLPGRREPKKEKSPESKPE